MKLACPNWSRTSGGSTLVEWILGRGSSCNAVDSELTATSAQVQAGSGYSAGRVMEVRKRMGCKAQPNQDLGIHTRILRAH